MLAARKQLGPRTKTGVTCDKRFKIAHASATAAYPPLANTAPKTPALCRMMEKPPTTAELMRETQLDYYNPFYDPNLRSYMQKPLVQQHLRKTGQMYEDGTFVPSREEQVEMSRAERHTNKSHRCRQVVHERIQQRLERMRANLDAGKIIFPPEDDKRPICHHCGSDKLTEISSAFSTDGYYVMDKCLACGRKAGRKIADLPPSKPAPQSQPDVPPDVPVRPSCLVSRTFSLVSITHAETL